ncbi:MAG: XdhC family protein [Candidatus Promineifilaceae bacterium]
MRDVLDELNGWIRDGVPVAMAVVVQTWGSSPRGVGAKMIICESGRIAGSVSGGCVEGAVVEIAMEVLGGKPPRLVSFGVSDDTAWDVGLACGGMVEVFVDKVDPAFQSTINELMGGSAAFAFGVIVNGPSSLLGGKVVVDNDGLVASSISDTMNSEAVSAAASTLLDGKSAKINLLPEIEGAESVELFVEIIKPAPMLLIVGGVHIAVALARIARQLGYKTVVVDPRKAFGTVERFKDADRLIQAWPEKAFEEIDINAATAVTLLTHDPKIDDPAAMLALASPAFYIGALGSRKTHRARTERLQKAGLRKEDLRRIHAPIGLDIGASSPEEIAVSIMAEIISTQKLS